MQTLKTSQKLGNYLADFAREIREAGGYTLIDRGFLAVSLDPAQYEHYHLRQYRTELVLKMRCQIFRQIV